MKVRFFEPVDGGHEVAQYVVHDVKFLGKLVLGATDASQTVLARIENNTYRIVNIGAFKRCEIIPFDEPDALDLLV